MNKPFSMVDVSIKVMRGTGDVKNCHLNSEAVNI